MILINYINKSSRYNVIEVGWVLMNVYYLGHAWFYAHLRVHWSLDAGHYGQTSVNYAWTPTSLITNSLGQKLPIVNHASLFCIENFYLIRLLVMVHSSKNDYFCLVDWKDILKRQKLNIPSHLDTTPLLIFIVLDIMRAHNPNSFVDQTCWGTVMAMLHWFNFLKFIQAGIVSFTSVRDDLLLGRISA